ncbi:MAG: hypothetical protein OES84_06600, partial [Kiritimatiellaceae bacterium]|nr:hypothetical protein [Kiritimatiellaceae bacterium]
MDKNKLWKWLLLGLLVIWSIALVSPPFDKKDDAGNIVQKGKVKLGLDLKGGSSFVVEVDAEDVAKKMVESGDAASVDAISESDLNKEVKDVQEIAIEVIRNRIDALGTAEPEIYPEGDRRIVVRLPGADAETRSEAKLQMSRDAVLNFKLVHTESDAWVQELVSSGQIPRGYKMGPQSIGFVAFLRDREAVADEQLDREFRQNLKRFGSKSADFMLQEEIIKDGSTVYRPLFIERRSQMGGDRVEDAFVSSDELGRTVIILEFDGEGTKQFGNVTESNVGRGMAIILDETLYSAPNINEAIKGGQARISGTFTATEARKLANVLKAGALTGRVKIVEERTVAPT